MWNGKQTAVLCVNVTFFVDPSIKPNLAFMHTLPLYILSLDFLFSPVKIITVTRQIYYCNVNMWFYGTLTETLFLSFLLSGWFL